MKKIKYLSLILFAFLLFSGKVFAAPTASSGMTMQECDTFADRYRALDGEYYYKSCYRVNCSYGVYLKKNVLVRSGYYCSNGNGSPYVKMDDGCKKYTGSCNTNDLVYCTTVAYVDCNRNADGSKYIDPLSKTTKPTTTQPTTVQPTAPTTKPTTTAKKPVTNPTTNNVTEPVTAPTEGVKSSNTNLKQLIIDDTEVKIDNNKNNYTIKIPYDVTDLPITIVPEDEHTSITITGNTEMPNEDSKISIKIVAEDGTEKEIILNVKRYSGESDDCTLANIYIENYPLDFEKNTFDYTLKLPKSIKSLDIDVLPTDELNATYEIKGNTKLKNNKKIEIVVVAQGGTKCNYSIKIKKSSNTWKYVLLIILLIGALATTSLFLYKYLKKSKGKYKYE